MRAPVCAALLVWLLSDAAARDFTEEEMAAVRQRIKSMFYHAYNSYLDHAFPYDELRPLTCQRSQLTCAAPPKVLGNHTEFQRVASLLQDAVDFDIDVNASVFETNIRGGSGRGGGRRVAAFQTPSGMPYGTVNLLRGVSPSETPVTCTAGVGTFILEFSALSRLTGDPVFEDTARRALSALWQTRSDIGLVSRSGSEENPERQRGIPEDLHQKRAPNSRAGGVSEGGTCPVQQEVWTQPEQQVLLIQMQVLLVQVLPVQNCRFSRFRNRFFWSRMQVLMVQIPVLLVQMQVLLVQMQVLLVKMQVGNHIDVLSRKWVAQDAGIGAGVDSYFEYLVKGAILLQDQELLSMFRAYDRAIQNYTRFDDWYLWVQMHKGTVSMPVFQSLEAFWPGLQSLLGDLDRAVRTFQNYYSVWRQFGGLPEFYSIPQGYTVDKREGYPLRPGGFWGHVTPSDQV
ncbi:unnamed protein product, partial [Menidia menidia]